MANKFLDRMISEAVPILEGQGCELVDAEYKKEGSQWVLRFYIELTDGRISLDDCAEANRLLSARLDEIDTGLDSFILEISSPGVERVLNKEKDYLRFRGSEIDVSLFRSINSRKKFTCILNDYLQEEKVFVFADDGEEFRIDAADVAKINLHFSF